MKSTELMLGDWYYWEAEGKKYPLQVTKGTFMLFDEDISNFQPIPLTPEILEKNGFYRREIPTRDEIGHYYHRKTNPSSIFVSMSFDDGRDFGNVIRYVHELQHLLKLCKIYKEIVV